MATAVREARANSRATAMVDAGDSMVSSDARRRGAVGAQTARKAELMADYLQAAKPEAVGLGELDLLAGASTVPGLLGARGIAPVATNVKFRDPAIRTVPFVSWDSAGYRFLFINLFSTRAATGLEGVDVAEPLAAMDATLDAAGPADVLLISCHRFDETLMKKLASRDGPLRILIDADGSSRVRNSSSTARTIIVRPPARGTELLTMHLHLLRDATTFYRTECYESAARLGGELENEARLAEECSLVSLDSDRLSGRVKSDPAVLERIEAYKAWARNAADASLPDNPDAPKYQGAAACGKCHEEQLANWKATVHAEAWESLVKDPDGGAADPECVSCHVSGFLQPGGVRKIQDTEPFRGVQCESCHAPIAEHPGGGKHAKINESLCRTCHSETRDPDFDFAKYLKHATCTKPHDPATNRVPR